jgi:hypothetical protein
MGPPIHYYGDMNMANDQDKNNTEDLEKMIRDIVEEVFKDFEMPEKDTDEEE